jgi:predicted enzyme related to lactoylglutathione lyase
VSDIEGEVMGTNNFVWYELVTNDTAAAEKFYGKVVGWDTQAFEGGSEPYKILSMKGKGVGGLMKLPEGMSEPFWLGYVGTTEIDAAVARWKNSGGSLHRAFEIPNVGRIALVSDAQGAGFAMIQGASDQPSQAFDQNAPGHGNWHELHTTDSKNAFDFYARQFGWTKGPVFDMGATGAYQLFAADGVQIGGMMNSPTFPRPMWLYYFGTDDVDDAAKRITGNGGVLVTGPSEVPGGSFIVQARDPQGAMFALVGRRG